jgi:Nucleotidyl transferase AbiEii toxin, Type IV TA system
MFLAAYEARRPTADLDALARWVANDQNVVVALVSDIACLARNDGVEYRTETATSPIIRDQAIYSGVRIAMDCAIATATVKFRLDVNFGDPITPPPSRVTLPSLRPGMAPVHVLGYPVETVLAEKIATAIALGPANTRVRDYADIYTLTAASPLPSARPAKPCSQLQRTEAQRFNHCPTRSATSPTSAAGLSWRTAQASGTPVVSGSNLLPHGHPAKRIRTGTASAHRRDRAFAGHW